MGYPDRREATDDEVECWREGAVAHIRFRRPHVLNAIGVRLAGEFRHACEQVAADGSVRALVLSGEGRAFMAGGDLVAMQQDPAGVCTRLIEDMHASVGILTALPVPVIASVHGAVAGGGLGLVLSCDLCIAAEGTCFSMAYPQIGASSDCGTSWALPRLVGLRKAMELAWLGEPVDAAEAQRLGIVNRVVPREQLGEATRSLAGQLAGGATLALGRLKQLLRASSARDLQDQLDAEAEAFLACATTADFREGVQAFLRKRLPQFTGA